MQKTKIMGILNVTPDSFSDGGSFVTEDLIAQQVRLMLDQGVDIIDIGGESTRPFAEPVPAAVELQRVIPAIEMLCQIAPAIPVSIDTTKAEVALKALAAGATMVNDISGLGHDPAMADVVADYDGPVIIMHMQGTPGDMQVNPRYKNVVEEIKDFFIRRLEWMEQQGIDQKRVILDPGIGFGKTLEHNLLILKNIREFKKLGQPVLIGHSRKSFFDKLLGVAVEKRDCPTAVVSALCVRHGADILRVHDVEKTRQAVRLAEVL